MCGRFVLITRSGWLVNLLKFKLRLFKNWFFYFFFFFDNWQRRLEFLKFGSVVACSHLYHTMNYGREATGNTADIISAKSKQSAARSKAFEGRCVTRVQFPYLRRWPPRRRTSSLQVSASVQDARGRIIIGFNALLACDLNCFIKLQYALECCRSAPMNLNPIIGCCCCFCPRWLFIRLPGTIALLETR